MVSQMNPALAYLLSYGPLVAVGGAVFALTKKWRWYARLAAALVAVVAAVPIVSMCLLYFAGDK